MRAGHTTPNGGVYIRMSHLGPEDVARNFAGMVKRCADCGFDLAGGLVEVVPTAHYLMGGIVCDADTRTAMAGLYVAGEDAGGAHGANRLGGNGVANSTVFGGVAGDTMAADIAGHSGIPEPDPELLEAARQAAERPFAGKPGDIYALREDLLAAMWEDVGVLRSAEGLARGIARLEQLRQELYAVGLGTATRAFNLTWQDWLNLESLIDVGEAIAQAAVARTNSRGAHFREDFPEEGNLAGSYFTVAARRDGKPGVSKEPVKFSIVAPGQSLIEEAEAASAQRSEPHSSAPRSSETAR